MKLSFRSDLRRALLVVVLSSGVGLVVNGLSPKGIPLVAPPKPSPKPEEFISLAHARDLWSSGSALFLDARAPEDYAAGHIPSAFNVPAESFPEHFPQVVPMLSFHSAIVVYCDGLECDLSHRLKAELSELGYTNTHILKNG